MRFKPALFLGLSLGAIGVLASVCAAQTPSSNTSPSPVVRIAELEIDPAHLDEYKALLKEEIAASIRIEPGVLTLYAVAVKGHPEQIRLFEIYRDQAAYLAHLQTSHFKKYKTGTQQMVKSLTLIETDPVLLGSKPVPPGSTVK